MQSKSDESRAVATLRLRAEELAREQDGASPSSLALPSREEALRLVHELRVHQIELSIQNDALCRTQAELNAARERYFDLYNLAPVGYFIVSCEGRILETNLMGVNLLDIPRAALVGQPVTRFIFKDDQDTYYLHRKRLLSTGEAHTCELRMVKADGTAFWVRLTATTHGFAESSGAGSAPTSRVVLSDISEQKRMKQDKAKLDARLDARLQQAKRPPAAGGKPLRSQKLKRARRKKTKVGAR